ncbi:MAG TPA: ribosome biogenesis GTP-binding protein YihA/YsxC [Polyangiaceae bacterium]|nr:ribosome biogenesis GTP-binding protein YihA/YsxC [Polyangiaceae bacterium]
MTKKDHIYAPVAVGSEFLGSASHAPEFPPSPSVEVAFAGRSNVGKSTLLNLMLGQKLAHTSSTPGRTRTLNFFGVKTRGGSALTFVDLPGYGYAKRAKEERFAWGEFVERYLLERLPLALVIVLVDARRGPEHDDLELLKMIKDARPGGRDAPRVLMVATKLDKLPLAQRKPALAALARSGFSVIGVSASDPASIDALWRRVLLAVGLEQKAT